MTKILTKIRIPTWLFIVSISWFATLAYATTFDKPVLNHDEAPAISAAPHPVVGNSKDGPVSVPQQLGTQETPLIVKISPERDEFAAAQEVIERARKDMSDTFLVMSSVLTALFTAVLAVFTIRLAMETKRLRQLADKQSEDTRASLAITKRSADAAIAVELPILIIESISIPVLSGHVNIKFGNHGRTPATITSDCIVTKLDQALPSKPRYPMQTVQEVSSSRIVDPDKSYIIFRDAGPSKAEGMLALEGKSILWAYGYVEYIDFLKERRRTGFCLAFTPLPNGQTEGRTDGVWVLEGPSAYTYDSLVSDLSPLDT